VKKLAIIGLGLMGGSLGLAAKKKNVAERVSAYARREETRKAALDCGAVDEVFDNPADAVEGADIVVLCVPVLSSLDLVKQCLSSLPSNCIVTDVGSTKAGLARELEPVFADVEAVFVGSHPICGSEKTGIGNAGEDLYEGAVTVIAPEGGKELAPDVVSRLKQLWEGVGSRVIELDTEAHDRMIARTSHLPHLVASMLVAAVCRDMEPGLADLCGSGFRDTTRLAAGSEDVWHDIVKSNKESVALELAEFEKIIQQTRSMVEAGDFDGVKSFLASAQDLRARIEKGAEG
jgi:prephenate dehydrogenase